MKIKQFHDIKQIEEAKKIFDSHISLSSSEEKINLKSALGRVISQDIRAPFDIPPFDRSQMDGYAVIAQDTFGADEENPKNLRPTGEAIPAGHSPRKTVTHKTASRIATGAPIPKGADAVAMVEHTSEKNGYIEISKPLYPKENIMLRGKDIKSGETVLKKGTQLTSRETAVIAALGLSEISVFKKPSVAIISTGNEIIPPGMPLSGGKIYDINSTMLTCACMENGAEPRFLGIAKDSEKDIESLIKKALDSDIIIITGGTSAGEDDLTYRVIEKITQPGILVHGIAMKPGKPTVLAAHQKKPLFILPGYPASCIITFSVFAKPAIRKKAGLPVEAQTKIKAYSAVKYIPAEGRHEFVLCTIKKEKDGRIYTYPITKTSGAIMTFAQADGYFEAPSDVNYIEKNEEIDFVLLKDRC